MRLGRRITGSSTVGIWTELLSSVLDLSQTVQRGCVEVLISGRLPQVIAFSATVWDLISTRPYALRIAAAVIQHPMITPAVSTALSQRTNQNPFRSTVLAGDKTQSSQVTNTTMRPRDTVPIL